MHENRILKKTNGLTCIAYGEGGEGDGDVGHESSALDVVASGVASRRSLHVLILRRFETVFQDGHG